MRRQPLDLPGMRRMCFLAGEETASGSKSPTRKWRRCAPNTGGSLRFPRFPRWPGISLSRRLATFLPGGHAGQRKNVSESSGRYASHARIFALRIAAALSAAACWRISCQCAVSLARWASGDYSHCRARFAASSRFTCSKARRFSASLARCLTASA